MPESAMGSRFGCLHHFTAREENIEVNNTNECIQALLNEKPS